MSDDIQAGDRVDEPDPIPASTGGGEAPRPDRAAPVGPPGADEEPDSDESGGPTAPQRPPADS